MEAIGLLVKLEARPGKEADAEAFLKSAQPLATPLGRYQVTAGGCVVSSSRQIQSEGTATGARAPRNPALIVCRHHILVRISH
jgi:hypothetical protein